MANASIFAAFERMWLHIISKIEAHNESSTAHNDIRALISEHTHDATDIDGVVTSDEIANLYVWKKYDSDPNQIGETARSNVQIDWRLNTAGTDTTFEINYADSISVYDGKISLVDESALTISTVGDANNLCGKYIYSNGNIFAPDNTVAPDSNEGYYFVPTNATFTIDGDALYVSNANKLSVPKFISYVVSKSPFIYNASGEHSDGYWYILINKIGDVVSNINDIMPNVVLQPDIANFISQSNVANLYVWEKYTGNPNACRETERSDVVIHMSYFTVSSQYYTKTVYCSSEIIVSDGVVSLKEPTSVTANSENVCGKYVSQTSNGGDIYYIPEDAVVTTFELSDGKTQTISNIAISLTANVLSGYVSSMVNNAYPAEGEHSDGYWYILVNRIGDVASIGIATVSDVKTYLGI